MSSLAHALKLFPKLEHRQHNEPAHIGVLRSSELSNHLPQRLHLLIRASESASSERPALIDQRARNPVSDSCYRPVLLYEFISRSNRLGVPTNAKAEHPDHPQRLGDHRPPVR